MFLCFASRLPQHLKTYPGSRYTTKGIAGAALTSTPDEFLAAPAKPGWRGQEEGWADLLLKRLQVLPQQGLQELKAIN